MAARNSFDNLRQNHPQHEGLFQMLFDGTEMTLRNSAFMGVLLPFIDYCVAKLPIETEFLFREIMNVKSIQNGSTEALISPWFADLRTKFSLEGLTFAMEVSNANGLEELAEMRKLPPRYKAYRDARRVGNNPFSEKNQRGFLFQLEISKDFYSKRLLSRENIDLVTRESKKNVADARRWIVENFFSHEFLEGPMRRVLPDAKQDEEARLKVHHLLEENGFGPKLFKGSAVYSLSFVERAAGLILANETYFTEQSIAWARAQRAPPASPTFPA
jgi:hypothetical protein